MIGNTIKTQVATAKVNVFPSNRMNPATGYGRMELGLMQGLTQIGAQVAVVDDYTAPADGITIVTGFPHWGEEVPGRKWAYTMSESSRVSQEWVDLLNGLYEKVLVPAPFLVNVYRESGVTVPVEYVPLGVDYRPPFYMQRGGAPEVFTWLTYSLGDTRKGAELAILAFNRTFGGDMRHRMLVKCRDNPHWLTGLDDPQIEIVRGETPESDWHSLLAQSHAFIFPSRGEGFGLPPREAVLSGLPTIATAAHGTWDAEKWGYPLPVKEMRPAQFDMEDANADGALWWEPDAGMIDAHMRAIVANYSAALDKAKRGREYLMTYFTWEQTARRIAALIAAENPV
jgi:glycosyltransferase involved in cell wall biosynthesis